LIGDVSAVRSAVDAAVELVQDKPYYLASHVISRLDNQTDLLFVPKRNSKTAKKGQVFVDMTTSSPTLAQKITNEFEKIGAYALDLPVTGGDIGARNATLSIMAGGDKKIYEEIVLPLVEKLGRNITYFGEAGKGQYTKLANQIAIATTMVSVAESLKFAKEVDLDLESFFKTVSTGSGGSFSMTSYAPRILKGDYEPGSFVHHFIKDMKLALEECEKMNIKLPGLETTYKVYNELEEKVRKTNGTQAIAKWNDKYEK